MNVEKLIIRLCIDEDNKSSIKRIFFQATVKANMVKHGQHSKKKNSRSSKGAKVRLRGGINKKKFHGKCHNYYLVSHKSSKCKKPRNNQEVNLVDKDEGLDMNFCVVVSKVNMVSLNLIQWWIDTSAVKYDKNI